ncbi:rho GTPase-activating protein 5-like [Benincasa hispida]|uniref:rho GTPase-activating protein 5-like n=1 Tax=Benincasa hispida TaxID=102211 RepID=UPI001900F01C|nr:rho GTPase-activating protein 5-like [Benincasa hispida]
MTDVIQRSPSHFPSSSSSSTANDGPHPHTLINSPTINHCLQFHLGSEEEEEERDREGDQLSLLTFLVAAFRKSLIGCRSTSSGSARAAAAQNLSSMEIGWPSNVRHVAHVTFDRFNGFLGLPVEFELEVPRRAPSASANVFGVSTESMQLSFDSRGNSVPTILLLMQKHLYTQGGLEAEGIFRITAGNSQEEFVRDQLNRGVVPDGVDVHCLAGLIKAWFRELPTGVLDSLSPEQVMDAQTEEECAELARLLPPTEAALLDWAVNLMADVVQFEHQNKMNARNVAMVFAPNMTQMADPLTALMYAVKVMNFLKTLIEKTLKDREDSVVDSPPVLHINPSDEDGHQSASQLYQDEQNEVENDKAEDEQVFVTEEPASESPLHPSEDNCIAKTGSQNLLSSIENIIPGGSQSLANNCPCEIVSEINSLINEEQESGLASQVRTAQSCRKNNLDRSNSLNLKKGTKKVNESVKVHTTGAAQRPGKKNGIVGRLNSRTELAEAWR